MTRCIGIVQPYIPRYRVEFFQRLQSVLEASGVRLRVFAGVPSGVQAARRDDADLPWRTQIEQRELRIGRASIKYGDASSHWKDCDALIVGAMGTSLDTYRALAASASRKVSVGVWGHIAPYVRRGNLLDLGLEAIQMRLASRVFAYTPGGAAYAEARGVPASRITTVMNTIDTDELSSAMVAAQESDTSELRIPQWPSGWPVYAYIGGLDSSKRIDFLAESLAVLWERNASVRVIVAGSGADEYLLDDAVERGQVERIGYADAYTKARLALMLRAYLNPGRIGLLAVDALVTGRPILAAQHAWHAPEKEYLVEGQSILTSAPTPEAYAELINCHATKSESLNSPAFEFPTIDQMVQNFSVGALSLLNDARG